jgi:hypothetical protein
MGPGIGWRVLPHFYAPNRGVYRSGSASSLSSRFKARNTKRTRCRWNCRQLLHGPGTEHGWNFEPAALLMWKRKTFSPSLDCYGEIASIKVSPRAQPEVHQLFLGGDWDARPGFTINIGGGFDLGNRGPGFVLKSRFQRDWDMRRKYSTPRS